MIPVQSGVRVGLAVGRTDMRKGMNGSALRVQQALGRDPHPGDLYVFGGVRCDLIKIVWHRHVALRQAAGARLVHLAIAGRDRIVAISASQLAYMIDGIGRTRFAPGARRRSAESLPLT